VHIKALARRAILVEEGTLFLTLSREGTKSNDEALCAFLFVPFLDMPRVA
jgi:hypothetical protein